MIDTSVFLWCITGQQSKLSAKAFQTIEDRRTNLWLSSISLWEITIKVGTGKLDLPVSPAFLQQQIDRFEINRILPVEAAHVFANFALPRHHRDPFDRMMIAQAHVEGIPFVTCDEQIHRYPIEILW